VFLNRNHVRLPGKDYIIMLSERGDIARNNSAQIKFRGGIRIQIFQGQVEPTGRHIRWWEYATGRRLLVNFHSSIDLLGQPICPQRTAAQFKSIHKGAHDPKGELLVSWGGSGPGHALDLGPDGCMNVMAVTNALSHLRRCGALTRVAVLITTTMFRGAVRGTRVIRGVRVATIGFIRGEHILVGQTSNRGSLRVTDMIVHAHHINSR
jgi:hypothetical protein